jgi:hypothetical protein
MPLYQPAAHQPCWKERPDLLSRRGTPTTADPQTEDRSLRELSLMPCLSTEGCRCTEAVTSGSTTGTAPARTGADPAAVITTSGSFPLIRRPGALHVARKTVLGVVRRGNIAQTVAIARTHGGRPPHYSPVDPALCP